MLNCEQKLINFLLQHQAHPYPKGAMILTPTVKPKTIYYIQKGHIKVYSLAKNGRQRNHVFYKPGEIFPLAWVFNQERTGGFFESMDQVVLHEVLLTEFLDFIKQDVGTMLAISQRLVTILNIHIDRLDNLEINNAYQRVVARLLFLAKRFGKQVGRKIIIQAPLSNQGIADSIALTRETTSRGIEILEKKQLVGYTQHLLVIKNLQQLEQELEK